MLCPTSAMYLHFCIHFQQRIEGNITKHSSYHIPHVFAVCPYRSVEIISAEVFKQLIDQISEELTDTEEQMLSDMTKAAIVLSLGLSLETVSAMCIWCLLVYKPNSYICKWCEGFYWWLLHPRSVLGQLLLGHLPLQSLCSACQCQGDEAEACANAADKSLDWKIHTKHVLYLSYSRVNFQHLRSCSDNSEKQTVVLALLSNQKKKYVVCLTIPTVLRLLKAVNPWAEIKGIWSFAKN